MPAQPARSLNNGGRALGRLRACQLRARGVLRVHGRVVHAECAVVVAGARGALAAGDVTCVHAQDDGRVRPPGAEVLAARGQRCLRAQLRRFDPSLSLPNP